MRTNCYNRDRLDTCSAPPPSTRQPGLLIVDEVALNLVLLKLEFHQLGCAVWLATNGLEALELYARNHEVIDLVVLETEMFGLDGLQTLAGLREIDPEVRCCFMTNARAAFTEKELRQLGAEFVLSKRFPPAAMSRDIWEHLTARRSRACEATESE